MAQTKNGARAGFGNNVIETLSGSVTLDSSDSGKVFLCETATVTMPTVTASLAGWHAKFLYKSGSSDVNSTSKPVGAGEFVDVYCDGTAYYNVGEY